ncbi:MAG: ORF6N domain-containing protein [Verrucomicrobia bacterium]|nr:ORF6N domain-containing protein [Verrucomicrobiota bacterium]
MKAAVETVPAERIQSRIRVLRGQRVLLDADLAEIYEVPTKRLIEQVKRNLDKFPEDFVFQLTRDEVSALNAARNATIDNERVVNKWSQNATGVSQNRGRQHLPFAFTEHGAIQAANVLSSPAATRMGIAVVRAFVQLRALMTDHKTLRAKLSELDARVGAHDEQLTAIVETIRELAIPVEPATKRKIGYHRGNR